MWINRVGLRQRKKIIEEFRQGVSVGELAIKYKINKSVIYYYVKNLDFYKNKIKKNNSPKRRKKKKIPEKTYKSYLEAEKNKKKEQKPVCLHAFWTKRCYDCKRILESERQKNILNNNCSHKKIIKKCSCCGMRI